MRNNKVFVSLILAVYIISMTPINLYSEEPPSVLNARLESTSKMIKKSEGGSKYAKDTRKILAKFDININDAANGVFLDKSKHVGLHTKEYYEKVHGLLKDLNSKEEVLETLKYISDILSRGDSL